MSLIPNALGLIGVGYLIDRGVRTTVINYVLVAAGIAMGFGVFKGVGISLSAAWALVCTFHLIIGGAMANVALPLTRVYEPLQVRAPRGRGAGAQGGRGTVSPAPRARVLPPATPPPPLPTFPPPTRARRHPASPTRSRPAAHHWVLFRL